MHCKGQQLPPARDWQLEEEEGVEAKAAVKVERCDALV